MVGAFVRRELALGEDVVVTTFPGGAAAMQGTIGAVYRAGVATGALGAALLWADRHGVDDLHVLIDADDGHQARRAAMLEAGTVWQVARDGAEVVEARALPDEPEPPAGIDDLIEILERHRLEIVAEHGVVIAELRGLEVARIAPHPAGPQLEVGVGRFDREAGAMLRGGDDLDDRLADALLEVGPHRLVGAEPHPVNRLCRERWLRSLAVDDPSPLRVADLVPVSPARPRPNLRHPVAAPARGVDTDGQPTLVMFSAGVDLDLVPHTSDLVAREGAARVVLAGLARDQLEPIRRLAGRLPVPVSFAALDRPWPQ